MSNLTHYNDYFFPVLPGEQWTQWNLFITISMIISILIVFPLFFYTGIKARNNSKVKNLVPFITGTFLILTEVYKQLLVTYHFNWEYHYYIFPFQLCAIPMYTSFLIPFIKNEKIKNSLFAFMAQFGMLGGVAVMLYQPSVLTREDHTLNAHSIIWHELLIALGIFSAAYLNYGKSNYQEMIKKYLSGTAVFISVVALAEVLNLLIVLNHGYNDLTAGGNLFYISMFMYNLDIPIFKEILPRFGWYIGFILYTFALSLAGFIFANIYYSLTKLKNKYELKRLNSNIDSNQ